MSRSMFKCLFSEYDPNHHAPVKKTHKLQFLSSQSESALLPELPGGRGAGECLPALP